MRNKKFTVLSAIAITLILLGHLGYDILSFGGLFPYYSYHVMIFVFIAGYFYKSEDEDNIPGFILRKSKRLLLPYFIWNLVYGIITWGLRHIGFGIGEDISIFNLLVAPFTGGHQFALNAPAWFIPALFLLEMCDMAAGKLFGMLRSILFKKPEDKDDYPYEWARMVLYLAIGILAVYLAKMGSVYGYYKLPGKLMFMAPAFEFGRLYKRKLEALDRIPSVIYFPVLFGINVLLTGLYGGLAYSTVWVTGFGGSVITPFITTFTGIALWLRISGITAGRLTQGGFTDRCICAVGENTYDICMHHLLVFMGINALFNLTNNIFGIFGDFDRTAFFNDVYYSYVPSGNEHIRLIYAALGLIVPVLLAKKVFRFKTIS